ncbi:hypothetical protein B0H13DRAFT_1876190 [Mycena leptocephala]|nr:hypothetical protein B0H13DRAFT_1876190 [Mycena leptocephala]
MHDVMSLDVRSAPIRSACDFDVRRMDVRTSSYSYIALSSSLNPPADVSFGDSHVRVIRTIEARHRAGADWDIVASSWEDIANFRTAADVKLVLAVETGGARFHLLRRACVSHGEGWRRRSASAVSRGLLGQTARNRLRSMYRATSAWNKTRGLAALADRECTSQEPVTYNEGVYPGRKTHAEQPCERNRGRGFAKPGSRDFFRESIDKNEYELFKMRRNHASTGTQEHRIFLERGRGRIPRMRARESKGGRRAQFFPGCGGDPPVCLSLASDRHVQPTYSSRVPGKLTLRITHLQPHHPPGTASTQTRAGTLVRMGASGPTRSPAKFIRGSPALDEHNLGRHSNPVVAGAQVLRTEYISVLILSRIKLNKIGSEDVERARKADAAVFKGYDQSQAITHRKQQSRVEKPKCNPRVETTSHGDRETQRKAEDAEDGGGTEQRERCWRTVRESNEGGLTQVFRAYLREAHTKGKMGYQTGKDADVRENTDVPILLLERRNEGTQESREGLRC